MPHSENVFSIFRVVLLGAESTGKTTLARQLSAHLGVPWSAEFAREYAASVGRPLHAGDVEAIARGQVALEDRALSIASPALLLDTDLVSTVVYAQHYYEVCPAWVVTAAQRRLADLYLLLDIDLPFTPDPVRDRVEARAEIQRALRAHLRAQQANVIDVSGVGEQRLGNALAALRSARPDIFLPPT